MRSKTKLAVALKTLKRENKSFKNHSKIIVKRDLFSLKKKPMNVKNDFIEEEKADVKISDDFSDECKTVCKICQNKVRVSLMRYHTIHWHKLQITKYKKIYGDFHKNNSMIIRMMYHKCHICGELIILDGDSLGSHIKSKHKMREGAYRNKYMIHAVMHRSKTLFNENRNGKGARTRENAYAQTFIDESREVIEKDFESKAALKWEKAWGQLSKSTVVNIERFSPELLKKVNNFNNETNNIHGRKDFVEMTRFLKYEKNIVNENSEQFTEFDLLKRKIDCDNLKIKNSFPLLSKSKENDIVKQKNNTVDFIKNESAQTKYQIIDLTLDKGKIDCDKLKIEKSFLLLSKSKEKKSIKQQINAEDFIKKEPIKTNCQTIDLTIDKMTIDLTSGNIGSSCDQYNESFLQYEDLKEHKIIHTKKKSSDPDQYKNSFSESKNLKALNLKALQTISSGGKTFSCDKCSDSFTILPDLKMHQEFNHEEEMSQFSRAELKENDLRSNTLPWRLIMGEPGLDIEEPELNMEEPQINPMIGMKLKEPSQIYFSSHQDYASDQQEPIYSAFPINIAGVVNGLEPSIAGGSKKKVELELSDRQIAALQLLGIL